MNKMKRILTMIWLWMVILIS